MPARRLDREFFTRPVETVARELLGKILVCGPCQGEIIETEAYHEREAACHAWQGRQTSRNQAMFAEPGTLYIYRIHQVFCLNLVAEQAGTAAAVLLRSLRPLAGFSEMRQRRGAVRSDRELCNGPGKLCQALGLDLAHNYQTIFAPNSPLYLEDWGHVYTHDQILITPRIGISKARELPWRFTIDPRHTANP